jgi:hypothetical protein
MRSKLVAVLVLAAVSMMVLQAAAAAPKPLPLRAHLIQRGEFAGFRPEPGIARYSTAELWVQADPNLTTVQRAAQLARLRREGFRGLDQELLDHGSVRGAGVSWTMRLSSPASARAELAASLSGYRKRDAAIGASVSSFAVDGVPNARGLDVRGSGQVGDNVFFTDGPYLYLVGVGWAIGDKHPPTRSGLISAVKKLYKRVHGHPAG